MPNNTLAKMQKALSIKEFKEVGLRPSIRCQLKKVLEVHTDIISIKPIYIFVIHLRI